MTEQRLILDKDGTPRIQTTEAIKGPVTIYAGPVGGSREQMHKLGVAVDGVELVSNTEWQPGLGGLLSGGYVEFTWSVDEIEWNPDELERGDD